MRKKWVASLLVGSIVLSAFPVQGRQDISFAASASDKQWLKVSSDTQYYGQVANGLPNGRGTIKWGENKQYSGDFVNGKRSGKGKYTNTYVDFDTSRLHQIVYDGNWKNDKMNGQGVQTEKVIENDYEQTVILNEIIKGEFKDNAFISGYDVAHGLYDPDFNFVYKDKKKHLEVWSSNFKLVHSWKSGDLFRVIYKKGSSLYDYGAFPYEDDEFEEKKRLVTLMYLRTFTKEVTPHLQQFEYLSKQVPLK